mmetsp:Transcript_13631/g.21422  ORF Transcript_13631/g.21422 Transcript_13631/m.21422 type:complete len:236 (+) Transcript_13631:67-774(+)
MQATLCFLLMGGVMASPLTVPLSQESTDNLNAFGVLMSDNQVDFLNSDINMHEYQEADGGWSPHIVNVIDGVEFENWGQFQSYCMHLRNLLKSGQVSKSQEAVTTLIDDYTLSVHYCLAIALAVDIGLGSTELNFCLTATKFFDADGEVYRYELVSDAGVVSTLFHYIFQHVTTALPAADGQTAVPLFNNPVLLSLCVMCFLFTLSCGVIIGCVCKPNATPQPKYAAVNASESEF